MPWVNRSPQSCGLKGRENLVGTSRNCLDRALIPTVHPRPAPAMGRRGVAESTAANEGIVVEDRVTRPVGGVSTRLEQPGYPLWIDSAGCQGLRVCPGRALDGFQAGSESHPDVPFEIPTLYDKDSAARQQDPGHREHCGQRKVKGHRPEAGAPANREPEQHPDRSEPESREDQSAESPFHLPEAAMGDEGQRDGHEGG